MMEPQPLLPRLDWGAEKGSYESCHLALQMIGKLPTRLLPWVNHGWHVALRVGPRGFETYPMPAGGGRTFTVTFDVCAMALVAACSRGGRWDVPVQGTTIAGLHAALCETLKEAGLPAPLHGSPNELPDPVPFHRDDRSREWDADALARLHGAFRFADCVFNRFRALYLGKTSPSHLFWGSFDLAVTRFSGRKAPVHPGGIPNLPDAVTREAYSHEVISAGFWPGDVTGGGGVEEAAFYAYAYPVPDALGDGPVQPDAAYWLGDLGEWVLPYAALHDADDAQEMLMTFLQSTYDAAADRLDWPEGMIVPTVTIGQPGYDPADRRDE